MYDKSDEINEGTKIEKFEIREKIEDILSKIVSSPKFVPLATAFTLSTLGITLSLSSGDHSHTAFAANHVIGGCNVAGNPPPVSGATHAIFWMRPH